MNSFLRNLTPVPIVIAGISLSSALLFAEPAKKSDSSFPGLKTLVIDGAGAALPEQISYEPSISKVINRPLNEGKPKQDDPSDEITRVILTKLSKDSGTSYFIDFDPGPSADPLFIITEEKSGKEVARIATDSLSIPGNGFVYALGRTNNMHTERQKFSLKGDVLAEVKQPYSYIGLDTKTNIDLKLTSEKDGGETIAKLPKGEKLEVVLRDGEHLLIKTPFGLVGWWKMKTDVLAANAEIEGIYFAGD